MNKKDPNIQVKELEDHHLINSFFDTLSNLTEIGIDVKNSLEKFLRKLRRQTISKFLLL